MTDDVKITIFDIILVLIVGFVVIYCVTSCNNLAVPNEQQCFDFYKENGYILDFCKKYDKKFKEYKEVQK